jgi:hypothetical protein
VAHIVRIDVASRESPRIVDVVRKSATARTCGYPRARSLERDELAPGAAQETMVHVVRINVASRDRPCVVDAVREGPEARTWSRARAGSIERDELVSTGAAQKTVGYIV